MLYNKLVTVLHMAIYLFNKIPYSPVEQ